MQDGVNFTRNMIAILGQVSALLAMSRPSHEDFGWKEFEHKRTKETKVGVAHAVKRRGIAAAKVAFIAPRESRRVRIQHPLA